MQVEGMNDQEKSMALLDAIGEHWLTSPFGMGCIDLYLPANMALAWRVHLWAIGGNDIWQEYNHFCKENLTHNSMIAPFWCFPDAQRLWLDEILSMLIEAGLVEVNDAS